MAGNTPSFKISAAGFSVKNNGTADITMTKPDKSTETISSGSTNSYTSTGTYKVTLTTGGTSVADIVYDTSSLDVTGKSATSGSITVSTTMEGSS